MSMIPFIPQLATFVNKYIFEWLSGTPALEIIGSIGGVALMTGGAFLLIKQAITGDEGFKSVKQIALLSLIPLGLTTLGLLINSTNLETALTNFFVVIRSLLNVWDFWINIPLLLSLFSTTLLLFGGYWTYKIYIFVVRFFNER